VPTPEDQLVVAVDAYLQEQGIKPIVIGGFRVQHQPEARQYNHELVINFTAKLPERKLCPVHNMPDCSPLLNGCSLLTAGDPDGR
jgi:hypothetical protein